MFDFATLGLPYPTHIKRPYNVRSITVVTPPAGAPLDVATAKLQSRVIDTLEDSLVQIYLDAAQAIVEATIGRPLVQQTWRVQYDRFDNWIILPGGSVSAVNSVSYVDENGVTQTMDPSQYQVDIKSVPARITPPIDGAFPYNSYWPWHAVVPGGVAVEYVVGAAPTTDTPPDYGANVPAPLRAAILLLAADLYANREAGTPAALLENPAVDRLLFPYRSMQV